MAETAVAASNGSGTPAPSAPMVAAPAVPGGARRAAARRGPVTTINYDYLKRDIRTLAVLAGVMIAVLLVAYVFLH